ncbi:MAG: hypothetical protein LIO67_00495 [Lachnospiraceae bacterium]|nr:hypothetical protein [Lachnospiraceae bacterium]
MKKKKEYWFGALLVVALTCVASMTGIESHAAGAQAVVWQSDSDAYGDSDYSGKEERSVHSESKSGILAQGILKASGVVIVVMASGLYLYLLGGRKSRKNSGSCPYGRGNRCRSQVTFSPAPDNRRRRFLP